MEDLYEDYDEIEDDDIEDEEEEETPVSWTDLHYNSHLRDQPEGEITVYKVVVLDPNKNWLDKQRLILELRVPEDAQRVLNYWDVMRVEKAIPVALYVADGYEKTVELYTGPETVCYPPVQDWPPYKLGETYYASNYNGNPHAKCAGGINCFESPETAIEYGALEMYIDPPEWAKNYTGGEA